MHPEASGAVVSGQVDNVSEYLGNLNMHVPEQAQEKASSLPVARFSATASENVKDWDFQVEHALLLCNEATAEKIKLAWLVGSLSGSALSAWRSEYSKLMKEGQEVTVVKMRDFLGQRFGFHQ